MDLQPPTLLADHDHPGTPVPGAETALACVLEYAPQQQIALPIHAGVELVEQPRVVPVPGMPNFCLGLLAWQGRQLPLVDLRAYLQAPDAEVVATPASHVLVVAYQAAPGRPIDYGALCAPWLVRMVEVADDQQCPLPADQAVWPALAISCFQHRGHATPVLDPARIFCRSDPSGTI